MVQIFEGGSFQERIYVINDDNTGVTGIIVLHSTVLGPAAGGCRFWHYDSQGEMAADAVRLAKGMSYKNALAGLPFGGGKAVIQRPEGDFDRRTVFKVFGEAVAALNGDYVTAEDVGTTMADMRVVRQQTSYVAGLETAKGMAGGDPSPWTALGVFQSMKAAAENVLQFELRGATVAVQGIGNVGSGLCHLLKQHGANLVIADVDETRAAVFATELGAKCVGADEIMEVDADVFAPCALGGILNVKSIPKLSARLICGGANNQLASDADGISLVEHGILYAPDYVVNAGGIINVSAEYLQETTFQVEQRVNQISGRLIGILQQALRQSRPPGTVADEMAQQIIASTRKSEAA